MMYQAFRQPSAIAAFIFSLLALASSDEHSWSLRHSEPSRDGRFLSVPIYYGDWVPISKAKQTIEAVASKIEAAHNTYRRVDPPPEIITAPDEPEDRLDVVQLSPHQPFVPYSPPSHHHSHHHQHHAGHHAGQRPAGGRPAGGRRRQDDLRNNRGHRKLPPPAPYANQFFGFNQQTTAKPELESSAPGSSGFNLGNVFNFLNPLIQHKPDIILHDSPAIKTLPAPDLTKAGPPVIELGGGYAEGAEDLYVERLEAKRRQEQQQEYPHKLQTDQHLATFVDVDFEHFVPGHVEDIEPPRRPDNRYRHPHQENNPGNFSVLVSGLSKNPNAKELAKLFKDGSVHETNHKAYITNNNVAAPEGFGKVTLPFLEPLEAAAKPLESLPPVFIAPVGYKVPPGYKGHPLPYDPSIVDKLTTKVNLLTTDSPNDVDSQEQVRNPFLSKYSKPVLDEPQQEVQPVQGVEEEDEEDNPTSLVLNKLKLARNRAQLAYKNKEPTGAVATPITPTLVDTGKKRKRILTKIVRKPYNPEAAVTASSSEKVTEEDVHTVVRIINQDEEAADEVTEATATTVLSLEAEEAVEVVEAVETTTEHFEPTTTAGYDHEAEPSDQVLFVTSPRPKAVNFITKRPKTTTETTTASTTSAEVTEAGFYQPTPFSPLDPLKRLRFKAGSKKANNPLALFGSSEEQVEQDSEDSASKKPYEVSSPLLKLRKYGYNQGANNNGYGQRIRIRQKPSFWANREETYEYYPPTTEATTVASTEGGDYKKKFRPFFDQLYEQLTGSVSTTTTEEPLQKLPYWAAKKATTTLPNPFSIAAEIYEVYPPSAHSIETTEDNYDDYTYEAEPRVDDVRNTEYIDEDTTEHETADKHSTAEHEAVTEAVHEEDNYVEDPESGFVHSEVHLDFGESQQHENTWRNELLPVPPRGLDSYQKDFYPSQEVLDQHDNNYKEPSGIFNEHSQQQLTVQEGDFIPFQGVKKIPYVEIQRESINEEAPLQISIEHVPTNDNDLIKNVLDNIPDLEQDDTTPYLFVTPTSRPEVTETTEVAETEVPPTTLVKDFRVAEDETFTETTEAETAVTFEDNQFTIEEPEATAEVEVEATTPEEVQVTTFRPKGGFFDSLTNFISNLIPSRTTTEAVPETTTTFEDEATTLPPRSSASTEKLLEPDHGIYEVESNLTNETEDDLEDDVEATTTSKLRLHIPKKYPPTARDDYIHLELVKSKYSNEEDITTTEASAEVSKDVFGAIKREEYFKNWVARKYKKPEDGKAKFSITDLTKSASVEDVEATEANVEAVTDNLLPFAPTVLPNHNFADYTRRKKKISFLEKLKTNARNSILKKEDEVLKPRPSTTTTTTTTKKPILYPRGSNLNLFKTWGGNTLSQAEFEKTILGVSTSSEVTVQSRICVRGQCFNADDKAAASSFLNGRK